LTENDPHEIDVESSSEFVSEPEDVASAARSCLVILIILAALVVIACIFGAVAIVK
jgi:hypothetical protein